MHVNTIFYTFSWNDNESPYIDKEVSQFINYYRLGEIEQGASMDEAST